MLITRSAGALTGTLMFSTAMLLAGPAGAAQPILAKANSDSSPQMHVEVTDLKRTSGDTVTLKAIIVNDTTKTYNPPSTGLTYLLDTENKKKLTVARDEKKHWLANQTHSVKPHSTGEIWAKFGAPPDNVQKLTVVIPKFAPMEDVPLSK